MEIDGRFAAIVTAALGLTVEMWSFRGGMDRPSIASCSRVISAPSHAPDAAIGAAPKDGENAQIEKGLLT